MERKKNYIKRISGEWEEAVERYGAMRIPKDAEELIVNKNVANVNFAGGRVLKYLEVNAFIYLLDVDSTPLETIHLNASVKKLYVTRTNIKNMELPLNIQFVAIDNKVNIKNLKEVLDKSDVDIRFIQP